MSLKPKINPSPPPVSPEEWVEVPLEMSEADFRALESAAQAADQTIDEFVAEILQASLKAKKTNFV